MNGLRIWRRTKLPRILLWVVLSGITPLTTMAQVPGLLTYQGQVSVSGSNFTGTGFFKFALVNNTGSNSFWSNDGTSVKGSEPAQVVSVPVNDSLFTVNLGDTNLANMTVIPSGIFVTNGDVRLRIWFNDGSHGSVRLTPDQRLTALGYAFMADTAGNVPDGSITSAKLASGAAAANLQAGDQSAVSSGGVIMSPSPTATNLLTAGYTGVGKFDLGESWQARSSVNAPSARSTHTAVWTGTEMIVWGGTNTVTLNTGGRYNPSSDTWTAVTPNASITPREYHSAVWTGKEMIVWGGYNNGVDLNDGWRFNPAASTWTQVSSAGAPPVRDAQTAVWTGAEMIIWGGWDKGNYLGDGARYNPTSNSWTPVPSANAPSGRFFHTAVWTGTEMLIWGGDNSSYLGDGGRYNPSSNTWVTIPTAGAPSPRYEHTAVWTGTEMIIWGGFNSSGLLNDGGRYNPVSNKWTPLSTNNAPTGRYHHTAVWTGTYMVVWGGYVFNAQFDGGVYNPATDTWQPTTFTGVPAARQQHTTVWTGSSMLVWGGSDTTATNYFQDLSGYWPAKTMYFYLKQ